MITSNAAHIPRNFDPSVYTYVDSFDNRPPSGAYLGTGDIFTMADGTEQYGTNWLNAHDRWLWIKLDKSRTSRYNKDRGLQCDHCGAAIRYVAVLKHDPTGDHIAVGETCLDTRAGLASKVDFDRMRKASAEARAEQRVKTLRTEFFATHPALEAILWPVPEAWKPTRAGLILGDMNRKLRKYGDLSEKQIDFARRLAVQAADELTQADRREAEKLAALPVPVTEGRQTITGVIVSRKAHATDFGINIKLTVKHADGWCVWVTEPAAIAGSCSVGDTIRFDAKLEVSSQDPKFAFAKRPSKAEVL